ncbi:hypothetical protein AMECASPLE_005738 [Ameca splendens]|uniref:Uncharacterized protein n=1 Tax=Ameca splendens TaxID=208324 RepID=A0ABV0ZJL0_9TELE
MSCEEGKSTGNVRWQHLLPLLSTWQRPGSCWRRQALSQPAATSRWCSTTCGGAKAFQGCLQAASQGWPSSAWEVSSSWEHMKRSAALCYSRASSEAVLRGLIWRGDAGRVSLEVSPQSAYCGPSVSSCSRALRNTMSSLP